MTTRFYMDTEFIEDGTTIELISIALVSSTGKEFYAINRDCDLSRADPWVQEHVIAKLPSRRSKRWLPRSTIRKQLLSFVRSHPKEYEFWAYFADYDWVVFCQLFGRMIDLPDGFPMYCCDLKQEMRRQGITRAELPAVDNEHDALSDARWVKRMFEGGVGHEWIEGSNRRK